MPTPRDLTPNSAAVRPDGAARTDAVTRADGAIRADGAARRDGAVRGVPNPGNDFTTDPPPLPTPTLQSQTSSLCIRDGVTPGPPDSPDRSEMMLPTSFAMPGRPSAETIGQRVHRMRAEGSTGLPDPANAAGHSAIYIMDAPSKSGRTVQ